MAYGSLIADPGPALAAAIVARRPQQTPFPVEYGRSSPRWGGGPVLVPHPAGAPVAGQLLILAASITAGAAADMLAEREGCTDRVAVDVVDLPGPYTVLAASLPRNLPAPDMRPVELARRALASAAAGPRNGVAYLRGALAAGIVTPLSEHYAAAILALTAATDLAEAERLVALPGKLAAPDSGRVDGLG